MEEAQKSAGNTLPVDEDTIDKVRDLQQEFAAKTNGKISQKAIAIKAVSKLTISDLLPGAQAQAA